MIPSLPFTQNPRFLTLMRLDTLVPDIVLYRFLGLHIPRLRTLKDDRRQRRRTTETIIRRSTCLHPHEPDTTHFLQMHGISLHNPSLLRIHTRSPRPTRRTVHQRRHITLEVTALVVDRPPVPNRRLSTDSFQAAPTERIHQCVFSQKHLHDILIDFFLAISRRAPIYVICNLSLYPHHHTPSRTSRVHQKTAIVASHIRRH